MEDRSIRILLVEDNPADARLVRELLRGAKGIAIDAVDRLSAAKARLSAPGIDIVLLDLGLPDSQGVETLARVRTHLPALPVIVLTGLDDEDLALEAVKAGAQDYLVKGRFDADSLPRAIRYAIERQRAQAALRHSEGRYRRLHESMMDCFVETRMSGEIQDVNPAYLAMLGYTREEALRLRYQDVTPARWHAFEQEVVETQIVPRGYSDVYEKECIRKDGTIFPVELRTLLLRDGEGRPSGMWALIRDITERKRADEALAHLNSALLELNRSSIDLSMLPLEEDLEGLIARQTKELSGAEVAIFSEYNPANRTTTPQHIEMNPGLLDKVVHLLGTQVKNIHSVVTDEMYREMTTEFIGVRRTLSEAAFGAIPPQVGKAIQALLRVDRFIGIAYLIEGKLHGTTLLGMGKDQPDPPRVLLENYVFLAASALRRKQAEKALNNKQRLLTETEKMGKVGGWEFDIVTQKQTWTEELYRVHEVDSTDNPTVDQGLSFYTPASRPIIERAVQRAIEQAEPFDVELEIMTAKGNLRMVHAIGEADLEHHRVFGFLQDITERKRAEEALRVNEAKLRALTEQVPVGIVVHAPDTSILFSNPMASEVLGLTPDQMRGKKAIDPAWCFIREDGTSAPLADYPVNQAMAKEMPISGLVLGVIRPDRQSPIWVECSASKIWDPAGELEQVIITFSDITARKLAEEALTEGNERLLLATTAGGVGIWELDAFNNKLTWDAQMFRLYGITSDEFGGAYETWKAGVHPEDVARADAEVQMALRGERGFDTEFRVVWPSGTIRHIAARAQVHRNAVGQPAKLIGTNYDVTELKQAQEGMRKLNAELEQRVVERTAQLQTAYNQLEDSLAKRQRAQEALQESEARFRRLSEAAFEAINIHDGGVLLDANEKYYSMFGFKPKELLGKQVMSLTIAPEAIEAVKKEIATGGVGPYETTGLRKDGTRFPMEIRVRGLEYEGRKVRVAAIMDITERKRAGEDLQQRTAQLEAANKELEAFSYSVSHDLRAPLRGIDGWSLALLEDYGSQLDGQAKTYLERVRSETQRMGQLIDDLLQLSRLRGAEMSIGKVDLSALAGTIASRLQKAQPDRRVEFVVQPGLNANGDKQLLEIALTNLLDNAFKFTGPTPQARIEFGQTEVEGQRAFFVRDNGAGFDMALAKKLFGAFQRMHKASEFPGTGVGLTTVQRIVHRHGGRIWAEAAVDQGATFYFTLEEIP